MIVQRIVIHDGILRGCRKVALRRSSAVSLRCRLRHDCATIVAALLFAFLAAGCSRDASGSGESGQARYVGQPDGTKTVQGDGLEKLQHIVVIYMENHSFDNLYGEFEGANGLSKAGDHAIQIDRSGHPYNELPRPP